MTRQRAVRDNTQKDSRKETRNRKRTQEIGELMGVGELSHLPVPRRKLGPVRAMNEAQGQLISTILTHDITFVSGPAGTGKTYLMAAMAAEELSANKIDTLIITRPMQACGEEMGFLPGEMQDKYAPWVEPVMDVLEERLGKSFVQCLIRNGRIQWKPLQYMRGKSLKRSWVILDEAQNVTPDQMKMFLTRIGEDSKFVINGDALQSDLRDRRGVTQHSGLVDAIERLKGIPAIGFVEFTIDDIVRHGVIRDILRRYG